MAQVMDFRIIPESEAADEVQPAGRRAIFRPTGPASPGTHTPRSQPMAHDHPDSPMRIRLSDDRRARLLRSVKQHFADEFDEPISDFRAEGLLDFFVRELGPPVYNQGVRDAARYVQEKLTDIEGEVYERDRP